MVHDPTASIKARTAARALALAWGLAGLGAGAGAQEYCVACDGPPAMYRCVIGSVTPGSGLSLSQLCVVTLTKRGGHRACAIQGGTVFDCNGPITRVDAGPPQAAKATRPSAGKSAAAPATPQPPASAAAGQPPQPAPAPGTQVLAVPAGAAPPDAPRTVEELARNMGKSPSGTGFGDVGKALGDQAKKSWNCVTSLFKAC